MSASNTRRLSLLTGSSLAAALLTAGAGGLALAPTAAFAANECGDPNANGASSDTFQCTGSYASIVYPATDGTLTLQLQNNVTTTTGGLVVTPTGSNTVTISRIADNPVDSGDPSLTSTSGAGIEVIRATGGTITVNLSETTNDAPDGEIAVSGTTAGVRLQNAGSGSTSFTSTNGTVDASAGAGIHLGTSGTGSLTVTNGSTVTGATYGIVADKTSTGTVSITNNGTVTGTDGAILVTGGTNATISNAAIKVLNGSITLNNTGTSTITNTGIWNAVGTSFLGDGVTNLNSSNVARIGTNANGAATTLDFGAGANTFTPIGGQLAVGTGDEAAATLMVVNLTNWNNSTAVLFGFDDETAGSDGVANDRIVAPGTLFTGSTINTLQTFGTSTLVMDVDFSADQDNCDAAVSGDCFDLRGSTTAGTTAVVVNVAGAGPAERVVLIDVAGAGASAAEHFTLSEQSENFHAVGESGVVESGMLLYELQYDAAAQQHALVATAVGGKSLEIARIGRAASEPWRTATGMWRDRQADLRTTLAGQAPGTAPGAWLKLAGNLTEESRYDTVEVGADRIEYNTSYDQRTTAVVGGVDLVRVTGQDVAWVAGVTAGWLDSELDSESGATLQLDGNSFGAYVSMLSGPLFVDGIVNFTSLDLVHDDLGQAVEGAATSFGYQVEGGYRLFQVADGAAYIEPIAALSYVRTDIDDLQVGLAAARFEEAVSLRGALGARFAGDLETEAMIAQFSFTGRVWQEFDSENASTLSTGLGDTTLIEAGPDTLGDVGIALGLFTLDHRLSAHLGYGVQFNDGYKSSDASIGLRFNW